LDNRRAEILGSIVERGSVDADAERVIVSLGFSTSMLMEPG